MKIKSNCKHADTTETQAQPAKGSAVLGLQDTSHSSTCAQSGRAPMTKPSDAKTDNGKTP